MICHYSSSGWWRGGISEKTLHANATQKWVFWFMLSYSFMDYCLDTKSNRVCIFYACQSSFYLEPACPDAAMKVRMSSPGASLCPLVWLVDLLLQRNIPMRSAKNAMRLMWWPPSETGGGSVLWVEPGPLTLPSSLSVWAAMMDTFPVLSLSGKSFLPSWKKKEDRMRKKERAEMERTGEGFRDGKWNEFLGGWNKGRRWRAGWVYRLLTGWGGFACGPRGGLSGPLAFLCSFTLGKKTHIETSSA